MCASNLGVSAKVKTQNVKGNDMKKSMLVVAAALALVALRAMADDPNGGKDAGNCDRDPNDGSCKTSGSCTPASSKPGVSYSCTTLNGNEYQSFYCSCQ